MITLTHDWRWFKFRYVIRSIENGLWRVFDCAYERFVEEPAPALESYRRAIELNLGGMDASSDQNKA